MTENVSAGPDNPIRRPADLHDDPDLLGEQAFGLKCRGDLAGARLLYERALAINEETLGPDHLKAATSASRRA